MAAVARDVEAAFGRPQDIEWAVLDGVVHLLQARPITILPVEPARPTGNNWQKDTAHYPEPMTPFGWSALEVSAPAIRSVFDEMGLLVRGLEERFVGGEIYGRVLPAFGSADSAGKPPPAFVLGLAARVVPELRRRTAAARRAVETGSAQRWADEWHTTDRDEMGRRADALGAVDLAALDDPALLEHLDACVALTQRGIQIHFRLVMPLFQALYRLHTLVGDELGWDDATIAGMLAGHSPATRAAEEAMASLRDRIRRTPGATEALAADLGHPVAGLRAVDPALADELSAWADEHGWAMVNYDAGVPVLAERPAMLSRLVLSEHEPTEPGRCRHPGRGGPRCATTRTTGGVRRGPRRGPSRVRRAGGQHRRRGRPPTGSAAPLDARGRRPARRLEAPSRPPPTPPTSRSTSCAPPWPVTPPRA